MKNIRIILFVALMSTVALWLSCSPQRVAGGGTDTESGGTSFVAGIIKTASGAPASNTVVKMVPHDFNPVTGGNLPDSLTDTTDKNGAYNIHFKAKGVYNIQAVDLVSRHRLLLCGIQCVDSAVDAPVGTLSAPGLVRVTLDGSVNRTNGFVYISGTTIMVPLNQAVGTIVLDSVPAGVIPSVVYNDTTASQNKTIRDSVTVESGTTNVISLPFWKYMRKICLNTTASGANVSGNVHGFPVLLRLNSGNFNFSQAQIDGCDIRFTKTDNTPLAFEIERWDPGDEFAEVWVNVDTVYGSNNTQVFVMYWGNPSASDSSSSKDVFGMASGFGGVWHLGQTPGIVENVANTASKFGNLAQAAGNIGYGISFYDTTAYLEMGNVLNPGSQSFTVSAWVKRSDTAVIMTVLSKSMGGEASSSYGWLVAVDSVGRLVAFVSSDTGVWKDGNAGLFAFSGSVAITDSTIWHHVAVVFDRTANNNCKIYLDGVDVSKDRTGDITRVGAISNTLPIRMGAEADGGYHWRGSLDEPELSLTARSSDWIQLCFMNQKSGDKLVVFK